MDIHALKSAIDLAALIEQTYPLLSSGQRYRKAKEHDSLVVDCREQVYYWNSRGESGDVFDWIGRHCLGHSNGNWCSSDPSLFKEAVLWAARYAGQPEPIFKPESALERAARLTRQKLMQLSADHYQQVLLRDEIQGYNYAAELRGFSPETISRGYLGYSDGALWQAIPQTDRGAAVELGLILPKGRGYQDAIPRGYLVYIHRQRAHVLYLSGRAIAEKRHMNQRGPKQMFWADWPGFGPLVIVEGQADALSVAQLGISSLALCGTNLADFDPDWLKLYNPIYIWQDQDEPDSEAARAWSRRMAELVAALGPLVRIIPRGLGLKDANDYLISGATPDDLQGLLKSAATFLDEEICRLAGLKGADRFDELPGLFERLTGLDQFQITRYRSLICKELEINQADFGRYFKAASGTLSQEEENEFSKGGQYDTVDGWTVLKTITDTGNRKIVPLANGIAKIIEESLLDDGSNEPQLDFVIAGELATGQKLKTLNVPAAEYATMKWTHQWGSRFVLMAGRNTQDHFRAAVQFLSGAPYRRTVYTHTGWREINGKMVYLTQSGALGAGDDTIQVDLRMGRPDTNMIRYTLPLAPQDIAQAMQISLNSWYIADLSFTVPLWAAMFLAPLFPFVTPDFGLWVHGQTGSLKSSFVAALLSHFGNWQGKDAKTWLPSNFQSTSNAILLSAFQAKDIPLVIDDFAPGATQKEVRERDNTASNLLRSVGNKAARGRMRDGRHFQADFPPRCLAMITAEDLPKTASIMARGIGVSVSIPPRGDPARKPIEQRLSQAQTVDSFFYPTAMAGFILWVQRHWQQLKTDLPVMAASYRDQISSASHARLPDAFGKLMAAIDTALYFGLDCGAITDSQARDRKAVAFQAMGLMLREHGEAVESVDATFIFQETLCEQLDAREWWLCPVNAESVSPPASYPIGCQVVGYIDDHYVYLLPKTVNDIIQLYSRLGTPFPVGRNTLYKRLIERGWLIPGSKATDTIYIAALGTSPRVLKLVKKEIMPS